MKCKICYKNSKKVFDSKILDKYKVDFFKCANCGFIQTEKPFWLKEAYLESINEQDTGLIERNVYFSQIVSPILKIFFKEKNSFLDYAGGYGIFTRLMQNKGFNFYWVDKYTENTFSKGFEYKKQKIDFCTLFDSNYIDRGLGMYRSLVRECPSAFVYIIAFDDKCYTILKKMNLKKAKIISLEEFEDKELLKAKSNRSKVEYMWTCSSSSVYYVLKRFKLKECTYIDADLYFYSNPKVLIDEMGSDSVLISEHRYTPKYDQSKISGKYCVQFMTFKNNSQGMGVLNWWKNACLQWCYARPEDGKFGDQKYLDDWTTRFDGVHVMQNLGGGVAPWNMQQYKSGGKNVLIINNKKVDLIFFHFHGLRIFDKTVDLSPYYLPKEFKDEYYLPYLNELLSIRKELFKYNLDLFQNIIVPKMTLKVFLRNILRVFNSEYNIIKLGE